MPDKKTPDQYEEPVVLVVEDNNVLRRVLLEQLKRLGLKGVSINNGKEAVKAATKEHTYKLVLMDVHMPVMDGLEATRRIKADPRGKETAIVVLTASAMDDDRRAVARSGADGFIGKPCSEDELLETVRGLLNLSYVYEETVDANSQPAGGILALSAALGQLPLDLVEELRTATSSGNKRRLDKLILQVRETADDGPVRALQELADKYEYDALTRLLEEACRR